MHGDREVPPNTQIHHILLRNNSHRKQRGKYTGVNLNSCLSPGGKRLSLCHREPPCSIQDRQLVLISPKWIPRCFLGTGKGKSPFEAKQLAVVLSFFPKIMPVKSSLPWHERPRSSYCHFQWGSTQTLSIFHNNVETNRQLTIVRGGLGKHFWSFLLNSAHSCIFTIVSVGWFNVIFAVKDIFDLELKFWWKNANPIDKFSPPSSRLIFKNAFRWREF